MIILSFVLIRFFLFIEFVCIIEFLDFKEVAGRKYLFCFKKLEYLLMLLFEFVEELRWEMGVMVRMVDLRLEFELEESFIRILLFELLYELLYEL